MNYATWRVERAASVDTAFTLYNRQAVERILREQPDLLPPPGKQMLSTFEKFERFKAGDVEVLTEEERQAFEKLIAQNKDIRWQKGQIQSVTAQAIVQGESIPNMAKRIAFTMGETNHKATIRYARTAMTGAQNAGRMDAFHRAESIGIKLRRQWVATLDERTRYEHRQLDGEKADLDKPFKVEGYTIMFPGDPAAAGEMIWNCRCSLIEDIKGLSHDLSRRSKVDIIDGDYDKWKNNHKSISHSITKQEEIGEAMKWRTIHEDYKR
jgi:uncharacterized protein with gpF-like domain